MFIKFLGIELDSIRTLKEHFKILIKKININLMVIRALSPYVYQKAMIVFYYLFFYPHLVYGVEFWGHATDRSLQEINLTKEKASR